MLVSLGRVRYRLHSIMDLLDYRNIGVDYRIGPCCKIVPTEISLPSPAAQELPRICLHINLENHPRVGAL